jgi:hypothetical protein
VNFFGSPDSVELEFGAYRKDGSGIEAPIVSAPARLGTTRAKHPGLATRTQAENRQIDGASPGDVGREKPGRRRSEARSGSTSDAQQSKGQRQSHNGAQSAITHKTKWFEGKVGSDDLSRRINYNFFQSIASPSLRLGVTCNPETT